ncbi:hypothetical protein Tco_1406572 [Tanacetum coccineum]
MGTARCYCWWNVGLQFNKVYQRTSTHSSITILTAKDIWENVKMILEGSELTKDDRESQLYDEFEHFRQIKGETISAILLDPHLPQNYNQLELRLMKEQSYGRRESVVLRCVERYNGLIKEDNFRGNNTREVGCSGKCRAQKTEEHDYFLAKRLHDSDYFKDKDALMQAQETDECDAFDSELMRVPLLRPVHGKSPLKIQIYDEAGDLI